MSNRIVSLSTAALLSFAALGSAAIADEAGTITGAKTTGALTYETQGLATNGGDVRHQGGFATAGAVQWVQARPVQTTAEASVR